MKICVFRRHGDISFPVCCKIQKEVGTMPGPDVFDDFNIQGSMGREDFPSGYPLKQKKTLTVIRKGFPYKTESCNPS